MKKFILIVISIICGIHCYSQTETVLSKKILLEYREEVDPYLQKFAKIGFSKKTNKDKETIRARYNMYLAKIAVIEKKLDERMGENRKYSNDKLFISKIIENQYRETFIGLPQEFLEQVEQRVAKL